MSTKQIAKMSATMLQCEERAAWRDVECAIRHGVAPAADLGSYVAALRAEMTRRGISPLPL